MITRRQFIGSASILTAGPLITGCGQSAGSDDYAALANTTWQLGATTGFNGAALSRELVRYATLAPSSHNTQCWQFKLGNNGQSISILPDLTRRCPIVDPDDHHLFVTLGCATENLVQAALAHGLNAQAQFDSANNSVLVTLTPTLARSTDLFKAIPLRQCTRADYDGQPIANVDWALLQQAGSSDQVQLQLQTDRAVMERTLDFVTQGNSVQMTDAAFMNELKQWVRFNSAQAIRQPDGLFTLSSGNPSIPTWLGNVAFSGLISAEDENKKYAQQIRSSAGIVVFVGQKADKAHWVEVGRCYERFALQATALGIRTAFVNQPIEVASLRTSFATELGLSCQRPDLVVRLGRGPTLPRSLRRPLDSVLI